MVSTCKFLEQKKAFTQEKSLIECWPYFLPCEILTTMIVSLTLNIACGCLRSGNISFPPMNLTAI